jgi:DNA (cytosine-5)-methyltransferase 1
MKVLSLFSGVGGMDLGLERAGHEIVAMCEIDKHARGVLAHHWPLIPLHTDVTTLNGKQYHGSIDIVSGGSPCQDLSVAGRRKGLDGARSGLFWHQCRIADECAAPWFLWENVPGALSSNSGADFAAVLWGITGAQARVPDGGWGNQGVIVGPKRWAVWRVLDAQWFGVAQRRKRVFVVGGPRTDCRPEILLESSGMRGDHAPGRTPGEEVAGTLGGGTPGGGPKPDTDRMTFVKAIRSGARDAEGNLPPEVWKPDTTCPTLSAFDNNSETRATVLAFDTQFGANANVFEEHSPTLKATQQSPSATTNAGVRRLTPIECERLMGWPDNWTLHTATGKQADSHRYRQTGNGVVANITHWIGTRLHP